MLQADLARRHVLHQVEHVVVAEEVGRLERRGLEALHEGVAVLQRDAEQIARAADGARRRLEQVQRRRRRPRCRSARGNARPSWLSCAGALPHRPDDVHHLPVRHPFAAGAGALLALGAGDAPSSCSRSTPGLGADRDVRLHAALPEREAAVRDPAC